MNKCCWENGADRLAGLPETLDWKKQYLQSAVGWVRYPIQVNLQFPELWLGEPSLTQSSWDHLTHLLLWGSCGIAVSLGVVTGGKTRKIQFRKLTALNWQHNWFNSYWRTQPFSIPDESHHFHFMYSQVCVFLRFLQQDFS